MATSVRTNQFRLHNAEQFYESFSEAAESIVYFFISRPTAWPDENNPDEAVNSVRFTEYDVWDNMLSMKRIIPGNVSYVARRIDWETGTIYASYRDNSDDMWSNNYFVLTEDFNIYKCIDNNSGAVSTVKPSGQSTDIIFNTADGYKWKFLGAIAASDAIKFLTTSWMPVKTLTADDGSVQWDVQASAANGGISLATVSNTGAGYWGSNGTVVAANSSTIELEPQLSADDELVGSVIYIYGGIGAGQLVKIIDWDGINDIATVNTTLSPVPTSSSTYILSPEIRFRTNGIDPTAYAIVNSNAIARVDIVDQGLNISKANAYVVANSGSGATLYPHLSPRLGHGANIVEELAAHNVMCNVRLEGDESGDFTVNNDFRVVGLIVDPIYEADGSRANATTYDMTGQLTIGAVTAGPFSKDEYIIGATSNAHGRLVEQFDANTLKLVAVDGAFQDGESIAGNTSGASATILTEPATNPIKKYAGKIIYIQNRSALTRDSAQTEDIKIVIAY